MEKRAREVIDNLKSRLIATRDRAEIYYIEYMIEKEWMYLQSIMQENK